jgi:hypothetical protein
MVHELLVLFVLAMPIACISWTVTHEEILREPREWCLAKSQSCRSLFQRKWFYLFTCEYCFSHYLTGVFLVVTRYRLLWGGWRGYLIAGFSLVWIANLYMSLFGRLRLEIKEERLDVAASETQLRRAEAITGKPGRITTSIKRDARR